MNISNPDKMKSKELRKIVREAIAEVLAEESTIDVPQNPSTLSKAQKQSLIQQTRANTKNPNLGTTKEPVEFVEESDIEEMARKAKGFRLSDENIDTTQFADKRVSGISIADVIEFFRENPGAEKTQLQAQFNFKRPQIANAIVNALKDAGVLVKLGAEGEPELGGDETIPVAATDVEDLFVGGAEDPLSMYFGGGETGEAEPEAEPEAGEVEKTEPAMAPKMSDEDFNAWMDYKELERRLAATKSNILKARKSRPTPGDIQDKPDDEVERLRALKKKLEDKMADIASKHPSVVGGSAEAPEIENPEEEPLDEWTKGQLQYYAGIKK